MNLFWYLVKFSRLITSKTVHFVKRNFWKISFSLGSCALLAWYGFIWVTSYYFLIPVRIDDYWNIPLMQIEINDKNYDVELDLGTKLSTLSKKHLDNIDKDLSETFYGFDLHGKAYGSPIYNVSKVRLHDFLVPKMKIREESPEFLANSVFYGDAEKLPYTGRLGLEVFEGKNFFLDFSRSQIILCKNYKDLARGNYQLKTFTQVPFKLNIMGICFQVETDSGTKTMVLDTGSSRSILRGSSLEEESVKEFQQGMPLWHTKKFALGGYDFGERNLGLFKIASVMLEIDGILGMDFLKEHAVYIDMGRHVAYIGKSSLVR